MKVIERAVKSSMKFFVFVVTLITLTSTSDVWAQVYGGFDVGASMVSGEDDVKHGGIYFQGKLGGLTGPESGAAGIYGFIKGAAYSVESIILTTPSIGVGVEYLHPIGSVGGFFGYAESAAEEEDHKIIFGKGMEYGIQAMLRISRSNPVGVRFSMSNSRLQPSTELINILGIDPEPFDYIQVSLGFGFEWGGP